jgi:hypothetical protein
MLIFLLFLTLEIEGEYYIQIDHSSSPSNLFFLDEGFLNPGVGYGVVGMNLNPAVLASTNNFNFYTGFSMTGEGNFEFDDTVMVGGIEEQIIIPFGANYRELGGIDFFGVSKRIGPVSVGISYTSGYKWGFETGLNGRVSGDFTPEEPYKFTHEDHPDIPEEDTIVIDVPIEGGISVTTDRPLRAEYSASPILIGAATGFGPLKLGAGLKFTNYSLTGKGRFSVLPDNFSVELIYDDVLSPTGTLWDVNLKGNAYIDDTLFTGGLSGEYKSTQTSFILGAILDAKILKLSLAYEFGNSYNLKGDYNWLFKFVSDFPEDFEIDTSGMVVDTINNEIYGDVGVIISDIPKEINSESGYEDLYFAACNSIKAAVQLDLFLFRLGLNGFVDFSTEEGIRLNRLVAGASFGLPIPVIDVNMGLVGSFIWLDTDDGDFFLPSLTAGLSLGYKHDNFRVDFPLKFNISQFMFNSIADELGEEEFDFWGNINFGLGIGISL